MSSSKEKKKVDIGLTRLYHVFDYYNLLGGAGHVCLMYISSIYLYMYDMTYIVVLYIDNIIVVC